MGAVIDRKAWRPEKAVAAEKLDVGTSVWLNVKGTLTEFLVVQQGNPNDYYYDSSCDGTWLLMKNIYEKRQWHSSNLNNYASSTIHSYLNGTFLGTLDVGVRSAIQAAKIPYRKGAGTSPTVTYGASGLTTRIFLLSVYECGYSGVSLSPNEGWNLTYFPFGTNSETNARRKATLNGTACEWWLRTPHLQSNTYAKYVNTGGTGTMSSGCSEAYGIRPAMIMSKDFKLKTDSNGRLVAA